MRMIALANRNFKEILRDPLNICFGLGFPIILIVLLSAIQANIPVPMFEIDHLTPGVTVFGLSFITLFSATLLSKDRSSSLLRRLYSTPLKAIDYILAYTIPVLPVALCQCLIVYGTAILFGLKPNTHILMAMIGIVPIALFYIALGVLCGSVLNDKQVGGICGALLTNVSAWLSGIWFDLELVGGIFERIAYILPFVHAVEMERALLMGNYSSALPHLSWVLGYTVLTFVVAVMLFLRQMNRQ